MRKKKKKRITDAEVLEAAEMVIDQKGWPWSKTEFNSAVYGMRSAIIKKGAIKAQLDKFDCLISEAPIKGGKFNPYSGD